MLATPPGTLMCWMEKSKGRSLYRHWLGKSCGGLHPHFLTGGGSVVSQKTLTSGNRHPSGTATSLLQGRLAICIKWQHNLAGEALGLSGEEGKCILKEGMKLARVNRRQALLIRGLKHKTGKQKLSGTSQDTGPPLW